MLYNPIIMKIMIKTSRTSKTAIGSHDLKLKDADED